jgi:hypothetical protein
MFSLRAAKLRFDHKFDAAQLLRHIASFRA